MQNPTDQAEASIPTEATLNNNDTDWNRIVNVRRKAANRTLPWDLTAGELDLVLQEEDTPARKRPRLEEPPSATTAEATREIAAPDVSGGLTPPTADDNEANGNAASVTDTQPNAGATGSWTSEEDAKLALSSFA
jgi:hypothetical protein